VTADLNSPSGVPSPSSGRRARPQLMDSAGLGAPWSARAVTLLVAEPTTTRTVERGVPDVSRSAAGARRPRWPQSHLAPP